MLIFFVGLASIGRPSSKQSTLLSRLLNRNSGIHRRPKRHVSHDVSAVISEEWINDDEGAEK